MQILKRVLDLGVYKFVTSEFLPKKVRSLMLVLLGQKMQTLVLDARPSLGRLPLLFVTPPGLSNSGSVFQGELNYIESVSKYVLRKLLALASKKDSLRPTFKTLMILSRKTVLRRRPLRRHMLTLA